MEDNNKIRVGILTGISTGWDMKSFWRLSQTLLCWNFVHLLFTDHRRWRLIIVKQWIFGQNFSIINSADDAMPDDWVFWTVRKMNWKWSFQNLQQRRERLLWMRLERALQDYKDGLIGRIVTAPINKNTIQSEAFHFDTPNISRNVGEGQKILMILLKNDFHVALVTGSCAGSWYSQRYYERTDYGETCHLPSFFERGFRNRQSSYCSLFTESSCRRQRTDRYRGKWYHYSCHQRDGCQRGVQCFGPYPADRFMGSAIILILTVFWLCITIRAWRHSRGGGYGWRVNYTAGLPIVRTSRRMEQLMILPVRVLLWKDSFPAGYLCSNGYIPTVSWRKAIHARPLRKQYYERRDDSDKLKLDTIDED